MEFAIHADYSVSNQVSNQCKASGISLKAHLCNFLPLKMVYKISSANFFSAASYIVVFSENNVAAVVS